MKKRTKIISIVLLSLLVVGIVSAGLLTYYGRIETTVNVEQAVVLEGPDGANCPGNICSESVGTIYSPGTTLSGLYTLTNLDPNNDREVNVVRTGCFEEGIGQNCDGITTTYIKPVAKDDNTNWGSNNNEAVGINVDLTLDELFAGDGLQYEYTVLDGGTNNGASPAIAVIDLADGRHIILFPGWGDRDETCTLHYSETEASDTCENYYVDFSLQPDDFSSWLYGSGPTYGDFEFVKGDTPLIDGTEVVTRVTSQHQAANTGQEDQIESMLINGTNYVFVEGVSGAMFTVSSDENPKLGFIVKNDFMTTIGTYTITTEIIPTT